MERPRWYPPEEEKKWRPEFILAMSKLFVSLKLHLFSLLFTYWLLRPQKHKVNRRFHVRDTCFSAVAFMSRTVKKKKNEIQRASFSKQSGLPSWKHASRYISKCFLPDEDKTAKFAGCSGIQINSCGHAS